MILGFGNNIRSALAADINSTQTVIAVMPGAGALFAKTLQEDAAVTNPSYSNTLYSKLTLTDELETVFEICHLVSVSGDNLTVIRGQEETKRKGWSLNDVVSNFPTRGSENNFIQIEDLQAGKHLSANAGGTANALTVSIPSTFYVNGGNTFALRAPLLVMPTLANTGPATVQLTVSGRVVGTYPVLKGANSPLEAGDIAVNNPIMILFSQALASFFITNPAKGLSDSAKFLEKAKNLSDLTDVTQARKNLGLVDQSLFLEKSKNLSDVADAAQTRKNLGIPDCPHLVGDVIFRANNVNPNTSYPDTTWVDLNASYGSSSIMIGGTPLATGGSDTVTLGVANIPSHTHTFSGSAGSAGEHVHGGVPARSWNYELGGDNNVKFSPYDEGETNPAGAHTHQISGTIGATGSGQAFSVVSKFVQLRAWMRTA